MKIKYNVCVCVVLITYNPSSQKFNQQLPFTHFSITQMDLLGHLNVQACTLHGPDFVCLFCWGKRDMVIIFAEFFTWGGMFWKDEKKRERES